MFDLLSLNKFGGRLLRYMLSDIYNSALAVRKSHRETTSSNRPSIVELSRSCHPRIRALHVLAYLSKWDNSIVAYISR